MLKKMKKWLKDKKGVSKFFIKNKKGLEIEMLGWWILGLAVLIVVVIGYVILSGKGIGAIEHIKNLFRFRG